MVKTTNKKQAVKPDYEAFYLSEAVTKRDPDGMGRGELRLIGQFPSRKGAEKAAQSFIQGTTGAIGYFVRKARPQ
jgi:hypothetical protein